MNKLANIGMFENLQKQAHQRMGLGSEMSIFNGVWETHVSRDVGAVGRSWYTPIEALGQSAVLSFSIISDTVYPGFYCRWHVDYVDENGQSQSYDIDNLPSELKYTVEEIVDATDADKILDVVDPRTSRINEIALRISELECREFPTDEDAEELDNLQDELADLEDVEEDHVLESHVLQKVPGMLQSMNGCEWSYRCPNNRELELCTGLDDAETERLQYNYMVDNDWS